MTHRGSSASPPDLATHITWECLIPKELVQVSILERRLTGVIVSVRYLLLDNAHTRSSLLHLLNLLSEPHVRGRGRCFLVMQVALWVAACCERGGYLRCDR